MVGHPDRWRGLALLALSLLLCGRVSAGVPAGLTFGERVRAQEALERVYFAHRSGEVRRFEEALPHSLLEARVRKYLRQSVALERFWGTPITADMLRGELERMARNSVLPERLRELRAALGNDPLLLRECLARPVLVDRLARGRFASDRRIHAATRAEAVRLREALLHGRIDFRDEHPLRSVVDRVRPESGTPATPHEIGPLVEQRTAFVIRVVLEEKPDGVRVASYAVPKRGWEDWWVDVRDGLAPLPAVAAASAGEDGEAAGAVAAVPPCVPDDTWHVPAPNGPGARDRHTAVWTGSEMIVWGGYDSSYLDTGGRYDPATDGWTPTTRLGAPAARMSHTAIWTGREMIVWGGYDSSYLDTGGRYDPTTDSWTPTGSTGAPTGRIRHTAVWTGRKMVVWGGFNGGINYFGTGGAYDPLTDRWEPTSLEGAPGARDRHTAVWTGEEMIVWGGYDGSYLETGGRYDPVTAVWTPTTVTGAPVPRYGHTAVWTGGEMIVWGGYGGSYLDDGARYDPLADAWTPVSAVGAPVGRFLQTAVWTGGVMVVWGGYNGAILNSGGRYDTVTDGWTPTSLTNAPAARIQHTAVPTGNWVIVWGGSGSAYQGSGGLYPIGHSVDGDGDGWSQCDGDCDDTADAVYPGAPQVCDGINNDCNDPAWPAVPADEVDGDADGVSVCTDCDDADILIWAPPGEARNLRFPAGGATLSWDPPSRSGAVSLAYDLLRTADPADFGAAAVCIESGDGTDTSATDADPPAAGSCFHYLVRARNGCPSGTGSLGTDSAGQERSGRTCP